MCGHRHLALSVATATTSYAILVPGGTFTG